MKTADEIQAALPQFIGTEHYYRAQPGVLLTDGAKYLADSAEAYWLMDIIWSVYKDYRSEGFHHYILEVDLEKKTGTFRLEDGNYKVLYKQEIPLTDFPLAKVELYGQPYLNDWVIMLTSEY